MILKYKAVYRRIPTYGCKCWVLANGKKDKITEDGYKMLNKVQRRDKERSGQKHSN